MDNLEIEELMHATRDELCELTDLLEWLLLGLEAGSKARLSVLTSLANIRRVMTLRRLTF
jgi:hypothetical protein